MNSHTLPKYRNLKFNRLNSKDGFSSDHIFSAYEDGRGFMWFGSLDGLNRFDSRKVKIYKHDVNIEKSISKGFVIPIIEDKDKIMWIGTVSGGLCQYVNFALENKSVL